MNIVKKVWRIVILFGYKTVMWSFAYFDWDEKKQPDIEESKKMIINNFHCGEVMLLHPNSKTNSPPR